MGAWGINVFDDDLALDLLDDFDVFDDPIIFMQESFNTAIKSEYLEYEDGINVLVSAALIDWAINETDYPILNQSYDYLLPIIKPLDFKPLLPMAASALGVVVSINSELNELWEESTEYSRWRDSIMNLANRLKKEN